ncbi:MAG: hypothetical protein OEZ34_16845 [Spirochaetia bacterium]|nr:hypothetical protein [Spirochaetia bacterium]
MYPLRPRSVPNITAESLQFRIKTPVSSDQFALCRFFEKYIGLPEGCGSNINQDQKESAELSAQINIENESYDISRNISFSVLSAGSFIGVTTSAVFSLEFYLNKKSETFSLKQKGRAGLWAFVLPPIGLPGSILGNLLNTHRKPEKTRKECSDELDGISKPARSLEACLYYAAFIEDALYPFRNELMNYLKSQHGQSISSGIDRTNPARKKGNVL